MTDSRFEDLRRRVVKDPASLAFAQLAEEYRRMGVHEVAVEVCRAGLLHHPHYVSARLTLGRSLAALGRHAEAREELETVLRLAPDNIAASRTLADLAAGDRPRRTLAALEKLAEAIHVARAQRRA